MSFHPIGSIPNISPDLLKALEDEEADFSGSKMGAYQITKEGSCFKIRKVQQAVANSQALSDATEELLTGSSLNSAIKTVAEALNEEVLKIKRAAREALFLGHQGKDTEYEIAKIQERCLAQLKEIATDLDAKGSIEALEKNLAELKQFFKAPHNVILTEALQSGNLDLAHFAIVHGADRGLLEGFSFKSKLSQEAIEWLKLASLMPEKKPQNLDHYALRVGLGYKTANLELMNAQLQNAAKGLTVCETAVPPLKGISHFEILQFIKSKYPELEADWAEFLDTFNPAKKTEFMQADSSALAKKIPLQITPGGEAKLREIRRRIEHCFSDAAPYSSLLLQEWLRNINPQFVIIRSTGKEDSDVAANAGGNDSIPFVAPNEDAISKAIGKVIASYFGEKSVVQRLQAGDQTVFTEKPFLPVLVQEMVCEPNLGGVGSATLDIPRSGVLFTRQPGRAEGVVMINSALGSNEGVVSSQVTVDTYAVHPKGLYKIIRDKESRFVQAQNASTQKIQVGPIVNTSKGLRKPPALTDRIAKDLASLATNFGRIYGGQTVKPMDMEYTILFKEKKISSTETRLVPVIYPLQIRPLLSTEELKPSFLKLDAVRDLKKENQVVASTLLSGNCSTCAITNPSEQVIFADDLPQALSKYQKLKDVSNIRLIVTRKTAPLTSHEAVTFSQTPIPVMPVADPESYLKVKHLMEKATLSSPCYADPQRSMIVFGEGKREADLIGNGLISYPGPREYTLPLKPRGGSCLDEALTATQRALAITNLFKESGEMSNRILDNPEDFQRLNRLSVRELMDKIAMSPSDEAKKALAVLNRRLLLEFIDKNKEEIKRQLIDGNPSDADDFLKLTVQLYEEVFYLFKHDLLGAISDFPPQSMERLFYLKPIEALIFQDGSAEVLNSFSFKNVLSTTKGISELGAIHDQYQIPRTHQDTWLIAIGKLGYRSGLRKSWYQFISKLTPVEKSELIKKVKMLQKLGMVEPFINILFNDLSETRVGDESELCKKILSTLQQQADTLEWLEEQDVLLKALEGQAGVWGVPTFAEKNIPKLRGKLESLGILGKGTGTADIELRYNQAGPFARLAILAFLKRAVTSYDTSLKSLSGSALFDSKAQKAKAFGEMLKPYQEMMMMTMRLISPTDQRKLMENSEREVAYDFGKYRRGLVEGVNYLHGDLFKEVSHIPSDMRASVVTNGHWVHPQLGQMEKYFRSPGFLPLVASLEGAPETVAGSQFTARSGFNVSGFIPGSKLDRNYSVHWPATLEEYFTVFHQTMEKLIKHEQTKNGMDLKIIPKNLQSTCEMFNRIFNITPSSIHKEGEMLEISYEVPLRQHAAKVVFKMNAHKEDTPIIMEITSSGIEESDRWKRTAAVASLMANKLGLPFDAGVPPQIYYNDPSQVSFALQIPRGYPKMEDFLKKCLVMIRDNTMQDPAHSGPHISFEQAFEEKVVRGDGSQFKSLFNIDSLDDWKLVPGEFFADSLYLNLFLLDHFTEAGDIATVVKIIDNSLQGLSAYGLKDYSGSYQSRFSSSPSQSLKAGILASLDHLVNGITKEAEATEAKLQSLKSAPLNAQAPKQAAEANAFEIQKMEKEIEKLGERKRELALLRAKVEAF